MLDMMKMMGKVKEMQAKLREAQENLQRIVVTGESGAGMVKATVNGKKKLLAIEVDPSLLNGNDKVLIQDLVVAAVNKAMDEADVRAREELRKSTEGMLPNMPGFDLSQMMG
jgi:DNA-binding YbaB/EbfC family protein